MTKDILITVIHLWIVHKSLLYVYLLHNLAMVAVKNAKEDVVRTAIVLIICPVFPDLA